MKKFKDALRGLRIALSHQSVLIQVGFGLVVCGVNFVLKMDELGWVISLVLIGIVISLEIINTCIERSCDLIDPNLNPKIRDIKDMSAAAVLVIAMVAAIIYMLLILRQS